MREGLLTQDADGTPRIWGKEVVYDFETGRWLWTYDIGAESTKKPSEPTPLEWLQEWLEGIIATASNRLVLPNGNPSFYNLGQVESLKSVLDRVKALQ